MNDITSEYKISRWFAEFSDRDTEASFQSHIQPIVTRQLRIALIVWGVLLLLFAIPDYLGMGLTRPFYYLLAYRLVMTIVLLTLFFIITPETDIDVGSASIKITATIGITQLLHGDKIDKIISRADEALYKGKEAGRNRVEIMMS